MGTTPRTRAKISTAKSPAQPVQPVQPRLDAQTDVAIACLNPVEVTKVTDALLLALGRLEESEKPLVAQDALAAARAVWQTQKLLEGVKKRVTALFCDLRIRGAVFEQGSTGAAATVQFKEIMKSSPQYKEEALHYSRLYAESQGLPWSQENFESEMLAKYPKKPSVSLSFA